MKKTILDYLDLTAKGINIVIRLDGTIAHPEITELVQNAARQKSHVTIKHADDLGTSEIEAIAYGDNKKHVTFDFS